MFREKLISLVRDTVETLGFILIECLWIYGKSRSTLRTVIHHMERNISTQDCEKVSRVLSQRLDLEELIDGAYQMVVESPGVEREIGRHKEYKYFLGRPIRVVVKKPADYGMKDNVIIGQLETADETGIVLKTGENTLTIPFTDISKANLYFELKKYLS
ncbi:MAG: hypothetical protein A2Y33_04995 [Spirochaetes bacterium GWF1_51_8]|nr:MAG: hypothetical protein A2Y33_04995 [Spirochaetes bacterium GWF1_51_8]